MLSEAAAIGSEDEQDSGQRWISGYIIWGGGRLPRSSYLPCLIGSLFFFGGCFGYFYFFSVWGPRERDAASEEEGWGRKGAGGMSVGTGGGAKYFFQGRNSPHALFAR